MNTRAIALDIFNDIIQNKSYLNFHLKKSLTSEISFDDKRFITALINITIENLFKIDYILAPFIKGKRVHQNIKNILRMGVAQILFLNTVPVAAAVNESVKLAANFKRGIFKGFVNAVLRNVEKSSDIIYPDSEKFPANYLHIKYSVPIWLSKKYISDYGFSIAESIFKYKGEPNLTCVRRNFYIKGSMPDNLIKSKYFDDAFYIKNIDIEKLPQINAGILIPHSESSMLCVRAANIKPFDSVLDLCAAPGGKSAYAAWFAKTGKVTAIDCYEHRINLMQKNFNRLNIKNINIIQGDATIFNNKFDNAYDIVLVDAPCSALGLIHRKPDIRIFKTYEDLNVLANKQTKILKNGARYVKRGGTLLYSTCTINNLENNLNIEKFLDYNKDFYLDDIEPFLPDSLKGKSKDGMLQLFPHRDGIDGFFLARLMRKI